MKRRREELDSQDAQRLCCWYPSGLEAENQRDSRCLEMTAAAGEIGERGPKQVASGSA